MKRDSMKMKTCVSVCLCVCVSVCLCVCVSVCVLKQFSAHNPSMCGCWCLLQATLRLSVGWFCVYACVLCSPHGCHVSKPKSHVWESRLCVCGFRLPHLWMRFNVCMFLCVWYMGIIPLVFSLKHFYMSPGDITQLFRRDILFFIFHLHTLPIYISSCSRSSVVWHIKALCLLYCGLGNIWTTASAIYQSTICQLHLTCVCGCIRIRWKEGESQHKQLPLVPLCLFVCTLNLTKAWFELLRKIAAEPMPSRSLLLVRCCVSVTFRQNKR